MKSSTCDFEEKLVLDQMKTNSTAAFAEFMRFKVRLNLKDFMKIYEPLRKSYPNIYKDENNFMTACLSSAGLNRNQYKIGKEYIFLRITEPKVLECAMKKDDEVAQKMARIVAVFYFVKSYWKRLAFVCGLYLYAKRGRSFTINPQQTEIVHSNQSAGPSQSTDQQFETNSSQGRSDENTVQITPKRLRSSRYEITHHRRSQSSDQSASTNTESETNGKRGRSKENLVERTPKRARSSRYTIEHHRRSQSADQSTSSNVESEPNRKRVKAKQISLGRKSKRARSSSSEIKHLPDIDSKENASRCKNPPCKFKTHMFCNDCKKHLCLMKGRNCYKDFHLKKK